MRTKHLLLLLFLIAFGTSAVAQEQDLSPWTDNPHGNEWIDYSKKYVRVGITQDGIYKIPLATLRARLGNDLTGNNVQAWFRGKQIALQIDGDNVVFYGRKNDGVSDGLMFRPGPQARLDYTTSFFSEEGAHFFTIAKDSDPVLRISSLSAVPASDGPATESFHIETVVKNNSAWLTSGDYVNRRYLSRPFANIADSDVKTLNNSFYQRQNAFVKLLETDQVWDEAVDLKDFVAGTDENIRLVFSIHGDGPSERNVEVFMGTESSQLTDVGKRLLSSNLSGFSAINDSRTVVPGTHITEAGKGYLRFSSTSTPNTAVTFRNRFGVSYYTLSFPQSPSFSGQSSKKYYFKGREAGKSKIRITSISSGDKVYDISDSNRPVLLNGTLSGSNLDLEVNRITNKALVLQVVSSTTGITEPVAGMFYDVKFDLLYSFKTGDKIDNVKPEPADYDYLVITHNATGGKQVREGAVEFAKYRATSEGGTYKSLTISTRSIYDQFNYGEPSPVAIGRFVNYMIQSGIKPTHNVLLVGHGVGRIDNIIKEIPSDVPTFGNPGSDVLLVSGLSNDPAASIDVPSVPIGRITAFTNQQVLNYLAKVEEYERQTREESAEDLSWRKRVLNLIGNKTSDEPETFNTYVTNAVNQIPSSTGPWEIDRLSNETDDDWPPAGNSSFIRELAPLDPNMNDGLGMLTYYGHGDFSGTIYNIGSPSRFSQASKRYPFVYITGCGVGDVYSSHGALYVATDWIITPDKGAIAMYANTFLAYTNTAASYMRLLYSQIFKQTDAYRRTLGGIQVDMARLFTGSSSSARVAATDQEIANVHQTALFGDPAIRILLTSNVALPVSYVNFSGAVFENSNIQLQWETAIEKNNDHFIVERSFDGKRFEMIGKVPSKSLSETIGGTKYNFIDVSPRVGINYYRLKQIDKAGAEGQAFEYSNIISVNLKIRSQNSSISVFPNPGSDKVSISSDRGDIIKSWKLYNSIGAVVSKGQETIVDISNLSTGIFILEVVTNNDIVTRKKIIKER